LRLVSRNAFSACLFSLQHTSVNFVLHASFSIYADEHKTIISKVVRENFVLENVNNYDIVRSGQG